MSDKPRGRAVIINNKNFWDEKQDREGTDCDKKKLEELFTKLFFDTIIYDDLSAEVRTIQYVLFLLSNIA